jgi:hypothetical protein
MAHKKGQGSVKNGRDSVSKRLGVKKFGSEMVVALCANAEQSFCPEKMLGLDAITQFLRCLTVQCGLIAMVGV